jgi:hypothetical protein
MVAGRPAPPVALRNGCMRAVLFIAKNRLVNCS